MSGYYDNGFTDPIVEACDQRQHPTEFIMMCSLDPVLTHDGTTSKACRQCHCGMYKTHDASCTLKWE